MTASKTQTFGTLKFTLRRPPTDSDPRPYWQAFDRDADGNRVSVFSGRAAVADLPRLAVKLADAKVAEARGDHAEHLRSLVKAQALGVEPKDLQSGSIALLLWAWFGSREGNKDLSVKTRDADRTAVKAMAAHIGEMKIRGVGPLEVVAIKNKLREHYAASTVKVYLAKLGAAWKWASRVRVPTAGLLEEHWPTVVTGKLDLAEVQAELTRVRKKNKEAAGVRPRHTPDSADAWALAEWMDDPETVPAWASLGYFLLLATGARVGEVNTLTWAGVDFVRGLLTLRGKTGERVVGVHGETLDRLRAARTAESRPDDRVLAAAEGTVATALAKWMRRGCEALGFPRMTPHSVRRFAVNEYRKAGVVAPVAAENLGHSPAVMLAIYATVSSEEKEEAAQAAGLGVRPQRGDNVVNLRRA